MLLAIERHFHELIRERTGDLIDQHGVEQLVAYLGDLGINRLALTSHYHAGFFLYGTNPKRRVHMLEDGVTCFWPSESFYADSPIKPVMSKLCNDTDLFEVRCHIITYGD